MCVNQFFSHFSFIQASISLPCSARNTNENLESRCRGSNNCYVWALDIEKTIKRFEDSTLGSVIANKRRATASSKHDKSDVEFLLLNEHTQNGASVSQQSNDDRADEVDMPTTNVEIVEENIDENEEIML